MYNPQIETFIAVAENGSFSKAAEAMFVTATAVMKQINTFEERIGVKLFLRTNHGLQLTEAGKSFLADAKYIKDYSERAIAKAQEIDSEIDRQSIRIGTSIMTPAKFLLDILPEIQSYDKKIKIELVPFENTPANSREILRNLEKHIDVVAGLYDDTFLIERGCGATHLYNKRILFAVPIGHPLKDKSEIKLTDLANREVMLIKRGWNRYIDELRDDLVAQGTNIIDFDMFKMSAYNDAVNKNVPIVTVDGWEDVHPFLRIIPSDWKYSIPFGLLHAPSPSNRVKKFIKIVAKATAK